MSVLQVIDAKLSDLTEGERQIGQFILDHPEHVLKLSSAGLAQAIQRSQSSVVKFSQKLGYAGYHELKIAISQANARQWATPDGVIHGNIELGDNYLSVLQKLMGSKLQSMQQTATANNENDINSAVHFINKAKRIQLAGVGASSLVARDFTYKLQKLGRIALHDADSHIQVANASTLSEDDVLVVLSHSGKSTEILHVAKTAQKAGAKTIAITGLHDNPLSKIAEISLFTVADEDKVRSSSITARDAQLMMTDLLFLLLVQNQKDANEFILNSELAVSAMKIQ